MKNVNMEEKTVGLFTQLKNPSMKIKSKLKHLNMIKIDLTVFCI